MATIYILEDDLNIQEIEAYALKNSGYQTEGFDKEVADYSGDSQDIRNRQG